MFMTDKVACPRCEGRGGERNVTCPDCGGAGWLWEEELAEREREAEEAADLAAREVHRMERTERWEAEAKRWEAEACCW